jgi:MYXO-CTERM domain-containing protein
MGVTLSGFVLLAFGLALAACGEGARAPEPVAKRQLPAVSRAADALEEGRCSHAAATLGAGQALACGGVALELPATQVFRSSCESFSGAGAGSFSNAASLPAARSLFTLTPLGGARAVAVGGTNGAPLGDVLLYSAGNWTAWPSLNAWRFQHVTVVLPSGALFAVGGTGKQNNDPSRNTISVLNDEILEDPGTSTEWTSVSPGVRRQGHTATLLPSGKRVLVVGGTTTSGGMTEEAVSFRIFDIASKTWLPAQALPGGARSLHTATRLGSDVIVVGGRRSVAGAEYLASVFRFREKETEPFGDWLELAPLAQARSSHTAEVVYGHLVVMAGYEAVGLVSALHVLDSIEVFDPDEGEQGAWFPIEPMLTRRRSHTSSMLSEGRVLVAGGCDGSSRELASAEVLEPLPPRANCEGAELACVTGHCVDGKCCDSVCAGSCRTCETGTCADKTGDSVPGREPCPNAFRCNAGECRTRCTAHAHCQQGHFCNEAGACEPQGPPGAKCSSEHQCLDGLPCVDGVCCERQCEECEACDIGNGVCTTFVGDTPRERDHLEPCSPLGTECGKRCDGVHPTCQFADETTTCGTNACSDGSNRTSLCDGRGSCVERMSACAPYQCGPEGEGCLEACSEHLDCIDGYRCDGDVCVVNTATPCTDGGQCGSGHCVDGYCCDSACERQCEACDVEGRKGICVFVVGEPHSERPRCSGESGECGARCDGEQAERCSYPLGTECGVDGSGCDGSRLSSAGVCDGRGACERPEPRDCAPALCVDGGCATSCTSDRECASGAICEDGTCVFRSHCVDKTTAFTHELGEHACEPGFRCVEETGECARECSSSRLHCDLGYSCDPERKRCVLPNDLSGSADGGCGCRVAPPANAPSPWVLLLLAAAAAFRRRRSFARS